VEANFSTSTSGWRKSNSAAMFRNSQRRQSAAAGEIYECSERRAAAEIYDGAAAGEIYECSERRAAAEIYDGGGQRRRGGITGEVLLQAATELLSGRRRRYMIVSPGLAPAEIYDCCGGGRGGGITAAQMYYGGGLRRRYCEGDVLRRRRAAAVVYYRGGDCCGKGGGNSAIRKERIEAESNIKT